MNTLNAAWQVASEEMYKNTQGEPGTQQNPEGNGEAKNQQQKQSEGEVTDVDFEEVKN